MSGECEFTECCKLLCDSNKITPSKIDRVSQTIKVNEIVLPNKGIVDNILKICRTRKDRCSDAEKIEKMV